MIKEDRTYIICEMSQTYEGKFEVARELVDAAIAAKADAIKFQIFSPDELATSDYKYYELFTKLQFNEDKWGELNKRAQDGGIEAISDVFGIESAQMLMRQGIDGFKIHPTDVKNPNLLKYLASTGKPLALSTGGSHEDEIEHALNILKTNGAGQIVLMHGFQSYPTLIEHTNLNKMKLFGERFDLPVGFADHIDGDHEQRYDLCYLAMGMGARVIEKHITSDRSLKMEDYESALDPADFVEFVKRVRALEAAFGKSSFDLTEPEVEYRKGTKKHIVAAHDLEEGAVIGEDEMLMKRTTEDYDFLDKEQLLGKKLTTPLTKDKVIRLEHIQ